MSEIVFANSSYVRIAIAFVIWSTISCCVSCVVDSGAPIDGVASAWQRRDTAMGAEQTQQRSPLTNQVPDLLWRAELTTSENPSARIADDFDAIATVNGKVIKRSQVIELLLRGHGPSLLNQLVVFERARALAVDRGLTMSSADLKQEYNRTLNRLTNPLVAIATNQADLQDAKAILAEVLAKRNISREEYDITIHRNGLLRKLVSADQHFTEVQIKAEYALMIGRKAEVRHIQVATPHELSRIQERLARDEDFSEVARRYSANTASAQRGGLLLPFAQQDDRIPNLLRETAFDLQPGGISNSIRVGAWYHVLKLERIVPAELTPISLVRGEIEVRLRDRLADAAMQQLYEKLLKEAQIEIHDPILNQAYEQAGNKQSR